MPFSFSRFKHHLAKGKQGVKDDAEHTKLQQPADGSQSPAASRSTESPKIAASASSLQVSPAPTSEPVSKAAAPALAPTTPATPATSATSATSAAPGSPAPQASSAALADPTGPAALAPATSTPVIASAAKSIVQITIRSAPSQKVYDGAMRLLEEEDQDTIRKLFDVSDVVDIKGVQDAVVAKQKECEEKKWTMKVGSFVVNLSTVAESLCGLLELLEPGIDMMSNVWAIVEPSVDIAAQVAPLHIGVPVAMIQGILKVVVWNQDQMEKLLTNVKAAVYLLQQLSLYVQYLERLDPATPEAGNLESHLASSYSVVLAFLAVSSRVLEQRGPAKAWMMWCQQDVVNNFEAQCSAESIKLERATSLCSRDSSHKGLLKIQNAIDQSLDKLRALDVIEQRLEALDLNRLISAEGASYDCARDDEYCLAGTRIKPAELVTDWTREPHDKILWISGMAGTGKTALMRTYAQQADVEGRLAASFFFHQAVRRDGTKLVPSIVNQLMTRHRILRKYVASALDADRDLPGGSIKNQFAKLLTKPLQQARLHGLVLVIDALDECDKDDALLIVQELATLAQQVDIRVVATSRPEQHLYQHFTEFAADRESLEEIDEEGTAADIEQYLRTCFTSMVNQDAKRASPQLECDWPRDDAMQSLVQITTPLFIFAVTVVRYIETDLDPEECLRSFILENNSKNLGSHFTKLESMQDLYGRILERVFNQHKNHTETCQRIIGAIALVHEPVSIQTLSSLLALKCSVIKNLLVSLRSVLQVPDDHKTPIRVLHKSFKDFILDAESKFKVDVRAMHANLSKACLTIMDTKLKKNMCSVGVTTSARHDLKSETPFISPDVDYACCQWRYHREQADDVTDMFFYEVLQRHLLHWIETLFWSRHLRSDMMEQLAQQYKHQPDRADVYEWLQDALEIYDASVIYYISDKKQDPVQIYTSILMFHRKDGPVWRTFEHEMDTLIKLSPRGDFSSEQSGSRTPFDSSRESSVANSPRSMQGREVATTAKIKKLWRAHKTPDMWLREGRFGGVRAIATSPNQIRGIAISGFGNISRWNFSKNNHVGYGPHGFRQTNPEAVIDICFSSEEKAAVYTCAGHQGVRRLDLDFDDSSSDKDSGDESTEVSLADDRNFMRPDNDIFLVKEVEMIIELDAPAIPTALVREGSWLRYKGRGLFWLPRNYRVQVSLESERSLLVELLFSSVPFLMNDEQLANIPWERGGAWKNVDPLTTWAKAGW